MTSKQRRIFVGLLALAAVAGVLAAPRARAEEINVAVAANFVGPLRKLATEFGKHSGHTLVITSGATGKLYAQIKNGAPFDLLLAADEKTPLKLESEGLTANGTRFTYAVGRLVLFSKRPEFLKDAPAVLRAGAFAHLAIANPKVAPYGAAALAVLDQLGLLEALTPKLVQGENIAQTLQFVESGNAELGFVAYSQVIEAGKLRAGSSWLVPAELYPPILQDAVVLKRSASRQASHDFARFLKSDAARRIIAEAGYTLPPRANH